jgi:NAD(P)-dependent dehydrogenase (short-subunit alcohol dehydrogenase family)
MGSDMFRLDGKTVAVVGAGSGIGEGVALAAGAQGAHVACFDLNAANAAAVAEKLKAAGGSAEWGVMDLGDEAQIEDGLSGLAQRRGRLDGLVCTPAMNVRKPILKYSLAEFDKVVNLNLRGNFAALMASGRIMTTQKSGSIVLFSSIRSIVTEPGQSVYSMTKAGILQLAKTAAVEWGTLGVRVNAVGPGVVETPLTAPIKANAEWYKAYAMKNPMNRWAQPSEMAGPTVFLLSDAASYVTGTIIYADGGWLAADGRFTPPGM